jgi:O-succinylbenzoate synthase
VTRIVELELVRLRPSLAGRGAEGAVPVLVRASDGQVSGWGEVSRATPEQW